MTSPLTIPELLRLLGVRIVLPGLAVLLFAGTTAHAQWVRIDALTGPFYNEVFFASATLGFISGQSGQILRTTDGGDSWQTVTLPGAGFSANRDISFPDATTGFISGDDGIWKTTNGGATFVSVTPAGAVPTGSASCFFRTAAIGVWGYGSCLDSIVTFWRTINGGVSWTPFRDTLTADVAVGGVTYSAGRFSAAGGSGKFWQSIDDGLTWTNSSTASGGWQEDLVERGGRLHIASADGTSCRATGGGRLLVSTNGGTSWQTTLFPTVVTWGVSFYSTNDGFAVGDRGAAYRSRDGGNSWTLTACGLDANDRLDDVWMIDATNGFAVGDAVYRWRPDTFAIRPDTLDFGRIVVGETSDPSEVTLQSYGTAANAVGRAVSGPDAAAFLSGISLAPPLGIPACDIARTPLSFRPGRIGLHTGTFSTTINGRLYSTVLRGIGVRPRLETPDIVDFDTLTCPEPTTTSVPIRNTGDHPLRVDSVRLNGTLLRLRLLSPTFPQEIAPGAILNVIIEATPLLPGTRTGQMVVYSNDPDYRDSARSTTLRIVNREVSLSLPNDTLVIPSRLLGDTSTLCLVVPNNSDVPIDVTRLLIEGDRERFALSFEGERPVARGDSVRICLRANAPDTAKRTMRLLVSSEPCMTTRVVVVCYQAVRSDLVLPLRLDAVVDCSEDVRRDSIILALAGDIARTIDSVRVVGSDAVSLISPSDGILLEAGGNLSIHFTYEARRLRAEPDSFVVHVHARGDRLRTVVVVRREYSEISPLVDTIGPISYCSGDDLSIPLEITNRGNRVGSLLSVVFRDANGLEVPEEVAGATVSPGSIRALSVDVPDQIDRRAGPIGLLLIGDCPGIDSLILLLSPIPTPLFPEPVEIDFGTVNADEQRDTVITMDRRQFDEPFIYTATLVDGRYTSLDAGEISLQQSIGGDSTVVVRIRLVAGSVPGRFNDTLVVMTNSRCDSTLRVPIRWHIRDVRPQLVFVDGDTVECGDQALLQFRLDGALEETLELDELIVENPGSSVVDPDQFPISILPGTSQEIYVAHQFEPRATGPIRLQLRAVIGRDTLRASADVVRLRSDFEVTEPRGTNTIEVRKSGDCLLDSMHLIRIANVGSLADTLRFRSSADVVALPSIARVDAGDTVEIALRIQRPLAGDTTIAFVSAHCLDTIEVNLVPRDVGPPLFGPEDLAVLLCAGASRKDTLHLRKNPLFPEGRVRSVSISSATSTARLLDEQRIEIETGPTVLGIEAFDLIIISDPCGDSIIVPMRVERTECRTAIVDVRLPRLLVRWGERVQIPMVVAIAPESPTVHNLRVTIASDPGLLAWQTRPSDSAGYRMSAHPDSLGWIIVDIDSIARQALASPTTTALLEATVLRGPSISAPLLTRSVEARQPIESTSTDGEVLLEDYCDAHGRLMSYSGGIGLKQVRPVPASQNLVVEYESSITGTHEVSIIDASGRLVLVRSIPTSVPGRRIEHIDVGDLPSGTYHLRLRIGRHRFGTNIVVVE